MLVLLSNIKIIWDKTAILGLFKQHLPDFIVWFKGDERSDRSFDLCVGLVISGLAWRYLNHLIKINNMHFVISTHQLN